MNKYPSPLFKTFPTIDWATIRRNMMIFYFYGVPHPFFYFLFFLPLGHDNNKISTQKYSWQAEWRVFSSHVRGRRWLWPTSTFCHIASRSQMRNAIPHATLTRKYFENAQERMLIIHLPHRLVTFYFRLCHISNIEIRHTSERTLGVNKYPT